MILPLVVLSIALTCVCSLDELSSDIRAPRTKNAPPSRINEQLRPDHVGQISPAPHLRREANTKPGQLEADIHSKNNRDVNSLLSMDSARQVRKNKQQVCTTFVETDGTSRLMDTYFDAKCKHIPGDAKMIRLRMGRVVDFFRPGTGQDMCSMLKLGANFEWSTDGESWLSPPFHHADTLGGSQAHWPTDGRTYISFWGHNVNNGNTGGCCHYQPDGSDTADWGRAFAMDYCTETPELFQFEDAGDCTDLADVAGTTGSNEAYWARKCRDIPSEAVCARLTMGTAVDYFMPVPGSNVCEMLKTSWYQYLWSPDGESWEVLTMHHKTTLGGSAAEWPRDGRKYISFWGHSISNGHTGGCCHLKQDGSDTAAWERPFKMAYCVSSSPPTAPPVGPPTSPPVDEPTPAAPGKKLGGGGIRAEARGTVWLLAVMVLSCM